MQTLLQVLTVCEVLGDISRYADTAVAVFGRGHTRSNKIEIRAEWEEGMPKPPSDGPKLQTPVLAKLSVVRGTTKLGSHQEPRFKADGHRIPPSCRMSGLSCTGGL